MDRNHLNNFERGPTKKFGQNPNICCLKNLLTDARTDPCTDVHTYGHLLGTSVLIFRLKIPNKMPKYPKSASNLLGTFFGH